MKPRAEDWLTAACCAEVRRPRVTFADLPQHHKGELARLAGAGAASMAGFVALVLLAAPLPSRDLLGRAPLVRIGTARSPVLDTYFTRPRVDSPLGPSPSPAARPRDVAMSTGARERTDEPATQAPRRRNVFSRLFRGVVRTVVVPD